MKIILFITFILLISLPTYSYAAWVCLIKDESAQVLLDYIKNNKQVIKNVTSWLIEEKDYSKNSKEWTLSWEINQLKDDSIIAKNQTVSIFNEIFNFSWYFSYFRYFAVFPISNEVPSQVTRDYKLLDKENKWLTEYIKKLDAKWNSDIIIKNACNWVTWKCEFEKASAKEIIWEISKNNDKILDLFRLSVIWEPESFNSTDLILVSNNFELEIKKNYWTDSLSACNSDEEWFFEIVTDAIKNIKLLNKEAEDGIEKWKEAWQLLIWNRPDEEAKIEKNELRNHLGNVWVSMNNQEIMNENLDKYNQWWMNKNNNFLTNTIKSTVSKTTKELKKWKEEVVKDFFTNEEYENPSYNDLIQVGDNSQLTKNIQERITLLYEEEIPFAAVWDVSTENLRAKIIETHFSLDNSINTLEKTLKLSSKFCNKQDRWAWKCD